MAPETINGVHCDNCSTNESKSVFVKQLSLGKVTDWFSDNVNYMGFILLLLIADTSMFVSSHPTVGMVEIWTFD